MERKIVSGSPIQIKDCKQGDIIAVTEQLELQSDVALNIVVQPSITTEMLKYAENIKDMAFNVIALSDGRPRTFHPDSTVYRYNRKDIFGE